jgi:hypothetical protein
MPFWDALFGSDEEQKLMAAGNPSNAMNARLRLASQLAAAAKGAFEGKGAGGALAGFVGGLAGGGKGYDEDRVSQAQAKIAGIKAGMPAWTQLPPEFLKGALAQRMDPSRLTAADLGLGGSPAPPGAPPAPGGPPPVPGAPPMPGTPPAGPVAPPGGPPGGRPTPAPSGDPIIDQARAAVLAGADPKAVAQRLLAMGKNPNLLGGF